MRFNGGFEFRVGLQNAEIVLKALKTKIKPKPRKKKKKQSIQGNNSTSITAVGAGEIMH